MEKGIGPLRNDILFQNEFQDVGKRLKRTEGADPVRSDTILNPCRDLPFEKHDVGGSDQKDVEDYENLDDDDDQIDQAHTFWLFCSAALLLRFTANP